MSEGRNGDDGKRRSVRVLLAERLRLPVRGRGRTVRHGGETQERPVLRKLKEVCQYAFSATILAAVVSASIIVLPEYQREAEREDELRAIRDNYKDVATLIYFRDGNVTVAKEMIRKAEELDEELRDMDSDLKYLSAFIDGMDVVYNLLNLDRQLTKAEWNAAHRALAAAESLIRIDPRMPGGYLLRGQAYMALDQPGDALPELDEAHFRAGRLGKPVYKALASWRIGMILADKARLAARENREAMLATALMHFEDAVAIFDRLNGREAYRDFSVKVAAKWPYMSIGNAYRDVARDFDKAIVAYKKAIVADPHFAMAHFNLGLAYLDKANIALPGGADGAGAQRARARTYDLARQAFARAIKANPGRREGYYGMGMLYGSQNKYEIAIRYFDKAVRRDPCDASASRNADAIDGCYLKALKYRARSRMDMGSDLGLARHDLDAAIRIQPDDAELYVLRARLYVREDRLDEAMTDIEFAHAVGGADHLLPLTEAELYIALGRSDKAIAQADEAIRTARETYGYADLPEAHEVKARAFIKAGRMDKARASLDKAVARAHYRPERFHLARGCFLLMQDRPEAALADFRTALSLNPTYRPAKFARRRTMSPRQRGNDPERLVLPAAVDEASFWRLQDPYVQICRRADETQVASTDG